MKAIIKKIKKGRNKGQFRFVLKADNGENLSQNEAYHNKGDILSVIAKYFGNFQVVDETKIKE